ncbi:MAG: hypothetical protein CM15mP116_09930 [Synechococcus sp.]|nr:MAG: hypothetical protein CM15mP116_09930 [Synechococcus sp.]
MLEPDQAHLAEPCCGRNGRVSWPSRSRNWQSAERDDPYSRSAIGAMATSPASPTMPAAIDGALDAAGRKLAVGRG